MRLKLNVDPSASVSVDMVLAITPSFPTPGPDQCAVKLSGTPSVTVTLQVKVYFTPANGLVSSKMILVDSAVRCVHIQ